MASNELEMIESMTTTESVETSEAGFAMTRRQLMSALTVAGAAAGIALVSGPSAAAQQPTPHGYNQIDVLNFLLNVKYLTATLYSYATQGADLPPASFTSVGTGGVFNAPKQVTFSTPQITDLFDELYYDELNHLIDLRNLLGNAVVGRQTINLLGTGGITASSTPVTITYTQSQVIALARMLEDVSVTAFTGATIYLSGTNLDYASRVLAADGFHAGALRLISIQTGAQYQSPSYAFGAATSSTQTPITFSAELITGSNSMYATLGSVAPVPGNVLTGVGIPQGAGAVVTSVVPSSGSISITGSTTSGSTSVTGLSSTTGLVPNQAISGSGIASGTFIASVGAGTLTLSAPATATSTAPVTLTVISGGIAVKGSPTVLNVGAVPGLAVGQPITSGTFIPAGTYITAIGTNTITLSQNAPGSTTVGPTGFITAGNAVIPVSSVNGIMVGEPVTGTLIPANATVTAIDPVKSTITLSAAPTSAPAVKPTGIVTAGSPQVTALSSTSGLIAGQPITGTGIPSGTFIGSITGNALTLTNSTGQTPVNATISSPVTGTYTFSGIVTAGSNQIVPSGAFSGIVAGQSISGTGIPAGATISSFNTSVVTISANATASSIATPTGITYIGSAVITNVSSIAGLVVGQPISGPGVPANTTISALSKTTDNPLTITMSNAATQINATPVSFSSPSAITLTTKTSGTTLTATTSSTVTVASLGALTIGQSLVTMAGNATVTGLQTISVLVPDPLDVEPADPGDPVTSAKGPQVIAGTSGNPIYQGFFNTAGSGSATANAPAGFAFTRTFSQVLAVLLNTNSTNAVVATQNASGGYYPVGVSGTINSVS